MNVTRNLFPQEFPNENETNRTELFIPKKGIIQGKYILKEIEIGMYMPKTQKEIE